jgi:uncharacterized protein (DUF934 family)
MLTDPGSATSPGNVSPDLPQIFRNGRIVRDEFAFVADDAPLPDGPVIITQKRFLAERNHLLSRPAPLGLRLESAESPELLRPDLPKLKLIELHVGHFKDGRAFSWARVLRTRLRFAGEIRVSGHFLLDQIAFYLRLGVDSFTLAGNWSQSEIERATGLISNVYQPSVDHRPTIGDLRRRTLVTAVAVE